MKQRYLRFVGKIWENGEFEPAFGWEIERIFRRPHLSNRYLLQLLDQSDTVIVETGVAVKGHRCCGGNSDAMFPYRIVGYLPLHNEGRAIVLRQRERTLYRTKLAISSPKITVPQLDLFDADTVRVSWEAEHERPVWFNVVFVDGNRRTIPIATGISRSEISIDTTELTGGRDCYVAVLATDMHRSSIVRTTRFDLPEKPPRVLISTPSENDIVSPDDTITLLGYAMDLTGKALPDEGLVWEVDGHVIARGCRMAPAGPLGPGNHTVQLSYTCSDRVVIRTVVQLNVSERTQEQNEWMKISMRLQKIDDGLTFSRDLSLMPRCNVES